MKRDMDLIRALLLEIEKIPPNSDTGEFFIEGRSPEEVQYHVKLLHQAGLIEAIDASSMDGEYRLVRGLTWNGHEFLEASRSQTIWNKAKAMVTEKGGVLSFEVMKATLVKVAMMQIF